MGTARKQSARTPSAAAAARPMSTKATPGSAPAGGGTAKRPAAQRAARGTVSPAVSENVAWAQAFLAGEPVAGGRAWEREPSADGTSSTLREIPVGQVARRVAAAAAAGTLAEPDAAAIRQQAGLSQSAFAAVLDVPVSTLRNWEQGRRAPRGPARQLLRVAAAAPEVLRVLQRHQP